MDTIAFRAAGKLDRIHVGSGVQLRRKLGFGAERSPLIFLRELRQTVAIIVLARAAYDNFLRITGHTAVRNRRCDAQRLSAERCRREKKRWQSSIACSI